MTLPATYDFSGAAGYPPDPPWHSDSYIINWELDGSGRAIASTPSWDVFAHWDADTAPSDVLASIEWAFNPTGAGNDYVYLYLRADLSGGAFNSGYLFWSDGESDTAIIRCDSGALTVLGTANSTAFASGDVMLAQCSGSTLTLSKNGSVVLTVSDSVYTSGVAGLGGWRSDSAWLVDNWTIDNAGVVGPPAGTHVVSGVGSFAVTTPAWLSTSIVGRPPWLTFGAANPANWYHVGMLTWGTDNGVMTAYPITRDLDLVHLPSGMTVVYYEFAVGVTATIVELASP